MNAWQTALALSALFFAACAGVYGWRRGRRGRHPRLAAAAVALRLAAFGVLCALVWTVFWRRPGAAAAPPGGPEREEAVVLVLQDASDSMRLQAAPDATRADLAEATWERVREAVRRAPLPARCERVFFARGVAGNDPRLLPGTDETRLRSAVNDVAFRERFDALVVVSDGASTDGMVPTYVQRLLSRRGVEPYAVVPVDPAAAVLDLAVARVDCPADYPGVIAAELGVTGDAPRELEVVLEIDGAEVERRRVPSSAAGALRFQVPGIEPAWHVFAVRAVPAPGEVSVQNNAAFGVFQNFRRRGILVLTGRPRLEDAALVRALRATYGDDVTVVRGGAGEPEPDIDRYRLLVLGEAGPATAPAGITRALRDGSVSLLATASAALPGWIALGLPAMPLDAASGPVAVAPGETPPAPLAPGPGGPLAGIDADGLARLACSWVEEAVPAAGSRVLVNVAAGGRTRPFAVLAATGRAAGLALLSDTTWKWAQSPDAGVRRAHADLVGALARAVIDASPPDDPFDLRFARDASGDRVLVRVEARPSAEGEPPEATAVEVVSGEGAPGRFPLSAEGAGWTGSFPSPGDGRFAWVTAVGRGGGAEVRSRRRPLLPQACPAERLDIRPNLETLLGLVGFDANRLAYAGESGALLRRMAVRLSPHDRPRRRAPPRRRFLPEAALALALLLLLGAEWYLERRRL